MSLFFVGLNPRWQQYNWLPSGLNVMYSAAGFWNGAAWRRKHYIRGAGVRWLDSGGFTLLNRYGDYPFSIVALMNLVAFLNPHYYASADYPCEPDISRQLGVMTNIERIHATVVNAVRMSEWENQVSGQLVPVIQGYTLDEYLECVDLHHQFGTIREYMAVGSMCRRVSNAELHSIIPGIAEHARQAGVRRLHFFGLKLSKSLCDLSEFIWSRDSAVVLDDYDSDLRQRRGGRRWPVGQAEKRATFEAFFKRLDNLDLLYR